VRDGLPLPEAVVQHYANKKSAHSAVLDSRTFFFSVKLNFYGKSFPEKTLHDLVPTQLVNVCFIHYSQQGIIGELLVMLSFSLKKKTNLCHKSRGKT